MRIKRQKATRKVLKVKFLRSKRTGSARKPKSLTRSKIKIKIGEKKLFVRMGRGKEIGLSARQAKIIGKHLLRGALHLGSKE